MKKRLLILMTVTGMIILLGGLLTYGLGVHEIIPVPRPDLIVVGTSLIGILLIVSGVCDLFVKKTKEMEIEENDERNISLIRKRFDCLERSCGTYADKRNCAESIF